MLRSDPLLASAGVSTSLARPRERNPLRTGTPASQSRSTFGGAAAQQPGLRVPQGAAVHGALAEVSRPLEASSCGTEPIGGLLLKPLGSMPIADGARRSSLPTLSGATS